MRFRSIIRRHPSTLPPATSAAVSLFSPSRSSALFSRGFSSSPSLSTLSSPPSSPPSYYSLHPPPHTKTITLHSLSSSLPSLPLQRGGSLPLPLHINYFSAGNEKGPVIFIFPSMSHSAFVTLPHPPSSSPSSSSPPPPSPSPSPSPPPSPIISPRGWWHEVVGYGPSFGIDLNVFRVIAASPLGGPFGTTSPLTPIPSPSSPSSSSSSSSPSAPPLYRSSFPLITPLDQARVHRELLHFLSLPSVFAVVGSSMGGMAAAHFLFHFPSLLSRLVLICSSARSTPSTVALRKVQREAIQNDERYRSGLYDPSSGPVRGMRLARQIGTIAYRSRREFDERFRWGADGGTHRFDVEGYLTHQGEAFSAFYDANCYLALSHCMDFQDVPAGAGGSYRSAARGAPGIKEKEIMILPIEEDALLQPWECDEMAEELGQAGAKVHYQRLSSKYGHDGFIKEGAQLNPLLQQFLTRGDEGRSGTDAVRRYTHQLTKDS